MAWRNTVANEATQVAARAASSAQKKSSGPST